MVLDLKTKMNLFYRRLGNKNNKKIVVVHGLYGCSDNWLRIGRFLSEYFEVFLIDLRNHGKSPHNEIHTYESMKNDLLIFVEKHQIKKAHFIGHSMGGKVVLHFALKHQIKIEKIILVDISPFTYKNVESFSVRRKFHQKLINMMNNIELDNYKSRKEIDLFFKKKIKLPALRQFLLKNIKRSKENIFYWKINIKSLYKNMNEIIGGFTQNDFQKYKTDFHILFIKGENSVYISEEDISLIQTTFSNSKIEIIKDAGHWLHIEKEKVFLEKISLFFKK